jgi:F-type H+-transporting ATPase subunit a
MAAPPGETDIFHHVRDAGYFHLPFEIHIPLPNLPLPHSPLIQKYFGDSFQITKYMVLQLVAGLFVLLVFRGLARRIAEGRPPSGAWWNFWETLALYIRDNVVRPTIGVPHDDHAGHGNGEHDGHEVHGHAETAHAETAATGAGHPADRFLPYVWTCFFYVLTCNLLGAFPWLGSPTAEINVTGALAVVTVLAVMFYGMRRSGVAGFWASMVPKMELAPLMKVVMLPLIFVIEIIGFVIKHGVLAIRLFANMMGGHTVIAVLLLFIAQTSNSWLYYIVVPSSVFGQIFVGTLELLVAFIQAYIFAFLATLFIGLAVNPH